MALCTTNTAVLKSGKKCKSRSLRVKDYGTYWYNSCFLLNVAVEVVLLVR